MKRLYEISFIRRMSLLLLLVLTQGAQADVNNVIDIKVINTDIAEVMSMLSTKGRVNILVNKGVSGNVSINLFKMSVKDIISTVARAGGYAVEYVDNTFYIVKPDDVGSRYKSSLTTIMTYQVRYSEPDKIKTILEDYLSDYGNISVLNERNILVIEDTPEYINRVSSILSSIDEMPKQILIEAKILEVTLSDSNSFGINWSKVFNSGKTTLGVQGLSAPASGLFVNNVSDTLEAT